MQEEKLIDGVLHRKSNQKWERVRGPYAEIVERMAKLSPSTRMRVLRFFRRDYGKEI